MAPPVQRATPSDIARGDLSELATGNNAFAFDLYQAIRGAEDDLLYSPFSISQALAMVYAGARGQTAQQMADTLRFSLPQERLHPAFNALDLELASRSHASVRDESGEQTKEVAFELSIANAVWGQKGYPFLAEYLDVLVQDYGSRIQPVDFKEAADAAVNAINRWVSEETKGRIQGIVRDLPKDTKLVLANAIYFNAKWHLPFEEERTYEEPFHLLDGREERVPMMHQKNHFRYSEGDGYQAIELPYLNRGVAMVILLPAASQFREIEERLTDEWMQDVLRGLHEYEVILTMPKFRIETPTLKLKETLSAMGMPIAFSHSADFFGIIERKPNLYINIGDVVHKAFIDVNEQRTEAAAVTIVAVEISKSIEKEPPPVVMKIDRPFIFFIRDIKTGVILFVGREMNPAQ
jgi:serpin B